MFLRGDRLLQATIVPNKVRGSLCDLTHHCRQRPSPQIRRKRRRCGRRGLCRRREERGTGKIERAGLTALGWLWAYVSFPLRLHSARFAEQNPPAKGSRPRCSRASPDGRAAACSSARAWQPRAPSATRGHSYVARRGHRYRRAMLHEHQGQSVSECGAPRSSANNCYDLGRQ